MGGAVKSVVGVAFLAGVAAFLVVLLLVPVRDTPRAGSTFRVPVAGRSDHQAELRNLIIVGDLREAERLARRRLAEDAQDPVNLILLGQLLERRVGTGMFAIGRPGAVGPRENGVDTGDAASDSASDSASGLAGLTPAGELLEDIESLRQEARWTWEMLRELAEPRAGLRTEDAEAQYHYAFALWGLGERLAAREVWLRAAELTRTSGGVMTGAYNQACCLALAGEHAAALSALRESAGVERVDPYWVRADPDLWPLHGMPEFWELADEHADGWRGMFEPSPRGDAGEPDTGDDTDRAGGRTENPPDAPEPGET